MTADSSAINLKSPTYKRHLLLFLLLYRWLSLTPSIWLLLFPADSVAPSAGVVWLLAITTGFTLLITLFHHLNRPVMGHPLFLGMDLLFIAILLARSGAALSLYSFYALSPLLAGAFFFRRRGLLLAAAIFTLFYLTALFVTGNLNMAATELGALFAQLTGLWLVPFLFEYPLSMLAHLVQTHRALAEQHDTLSRSLNQLTGQHQQLEMLHELSLFLQGAPDSQSVQNRLLKAVTADLNFSRAIIGLHNPTRQQLEDWQTLPPWPGGETGPVPMALTPENGPIAQTALDRQLRRHASTQQTPLANDETMKLWLGHENWLILPMVWQEQIVGVLLVAVKTTGPVDTTDDRWPILTALVSQAAMALGTLDRTRRLAVEQERNRIARDIHDTVAQSLFGIAFTLDACIKLLPNHAEMVRQELSELRSVAERVRQEVRQSILDIWPSGLTKEKFQADLCKYVAHTAPDHVFNIEFNIDGDFDGLPAVIRRSLYRVSQEALGNAARHAGVDSARLYLYIEPNEVYLSIRDKGRGFDPKMMLARERNRERFGLRGMQERIEALHGTCNILSQANQGTQVLVQIPLKERNGHG